MSTYRRNTGHLVLSVLLFTLSFAVKAQTPTPAGWYDSRWKIVDSLANKKGLTVSALTEINTICNRARQDRNDPQLIKALIYRIRLQQGREEDADLHAISLVDSQINITTQPSARAILNSIQAGMYWRYFQNNRYQLYQRTATTGITKKDPSSWSADDFHKKIGDLFLASIKDEQLLQRTRLDAYDPILEKGNVRNLRPTLFDLLAHRALEYFQTDDRDLNRPAAAFEIDDTAAYAPAAIFASHQFRTTDTLSLKLNALRLFQRLLQFHLADQQPAALLDLDIERIVFVNNSSVSYNKQDLYMRALKGLTDRYDRDPAAAQAWYLQASYYNDLAAGYSPYEDSTGRYGYVKAKEICEKVIAEKDSSEGQAGCMNLLNGIRQKSLELRMENVNIPGQPMRGMLTWRNFTRLYWRLIPVSHAIKEDLGNSAWQDSWWKKLLQLPTQRSADQDLPQTDDFQPHHAELKIDALPVGEYVLLASASPSFELAKNVMAAQFFYVSSIAYAANDNNYFVLDRQTGHPLPGATVQLWNRDYNNKTAKYEPHKAETYTTDSHGSFVLQRQLYRQNALEPLLEFTTAKDHLFSDQSTDFVYSDAAAASVSRQQYEKNNLQTFLFTDRSIYRPGQTLYYKGIVVTKDFDTRQSKSLTGFQTKIILYDANGTRVDSTTVTTNAYGSYKGQFTLPANLLNGEFRIEDDSTGGQKNVSVEEYKRPKFFVEYDKVKGSYRVNDTISINGNATAYAGNAISGATVKYRVTRQARYPIWYSRWRNPVMDRGQEIAHGEIRTDAAGKFNIRFIALPDRSNNEKSDPIFEYSITADITDINNETRSGKTTVQAGYRTIELTITRPASADMPADSLKTLQVCAANLSGEPVPARVDISIYPLKAPDRLIRKRLWERPDQFLMSKDEYLRNFPLDEYDNELDQTSWERGEKVFAATDSAGRILSLIPQNGKPLKPGNYLVEASTKDQYGRIAIQKMYLRLYSPDAPAQPSWLWTSDAGEGVQTVEPGARATLDIGSSAADIFLIRKTEKGAGKDQSSFSYLSLDKNHQRTELPITESDRGGFIVSDLFIRDNRPYTYTHRIDVPWTNKELSISYQTWRDKTLPGSEEKWQLKIAGNKTDKVTAEILTAMYDASLDQFKPQQWSVPDLYPSFSGGEGWNTFSNFSAVLARQNINNSNSYVSYPKNYDVLLDPNTVGPNPHIRRYTRSGEMFVHAESRKLASPMAALSGRTPGLAIQVPDLEKDADGSKGIMRDTVIIEDNSSSSKPASSPTQNPVQVRTNLKETAFFFPDLHTDSEGNLSLSFTMPEALTKWKMMTLAHTKDLSFGYSEKTIVTQKQLMVQPNMPRFLREGDRMELSVKVVNLTDSEMTGQMELQLIDPTTGHTADGQFTNRQPNQYFTVAAKQSAIVNFPIDIPYQYNKPLTWRVVAHARQYSDGEEATLPVVSNRMLVTESLPLNLPGDGTRQFKFDKLINSGNSETLSQHALTVEFTGNPAWYAVQALPYLMEYPYECAEQTFNRFYANALASKIVSGAPRIQAIFSQWKNLDTAALLSNLEKNQELKSVLLQETPWVLQGKSESQQKKNIALLFDMVRLNSQLESTLARLAAMQSSAGGFVWFKGGPDDRYITQYILTGIGHLQKLQAIPQTCANKINAIVRNAIPYLDQQIKKDYQEVLRLQKAQTAATPKSAKAGQPPAKSARPAATAKIAWIDAIPAQYLYMRSLFEQGIPGDVLPAVSYYRKQAQQSWQQQGRFQQGMIALALYRTGDIQTAKNIMASLRENAIRDEEKGMYWKNMERGYYWYQAPIETQSLLIEAFHTISPDAGIERDCKTWLLRQKQTHSWPTTRATADACYALLLDGMDWLSAERDVRIQLGDKTATSTETGSEAGTGYFKKVFDGPFVNPSMGNITVTVSTHQANVASAGTPAAASPSTATITAGTTSRNSPAPPAGASTGRAAGLPAWGAVYWQYFDNLDHITAAENSKAPLKLTKRLFLQRNTDRGVVLEPIAENAALHPGDKVTVRIEISSDRDLEYVHMKDMRASCMEPVNVLSDYKWQGGLGYYETTKDASTDFFFSRLPRGTFVFEYPLFVGQTGNFSNGVTSIECMYAPEFSFHSEGIRVNVENPTP